MSASSRWNKQMDRRTFLRQAATASMGVAAAGGISVMRPGSSTASSRLTAQAGGSPTLTLGFPSWMFGEPSTGRYYKELAAAYSVVHPNQKIDLITLPAGQYVEKIFTEISGGQVPDILPLFTTQMPQYIHLGLLEPLDPWLDKAPFTKKILPLQKFAQKDHKNYGVVLTASPQGLLYNHELLQKAEVGVPTTLDELYNAADKVFKKTGVFGYGIHVDPSTMLLAYVSCMQWVLGHGSDFSKSDGTITCNAPKTVEAFNQMMRFVNASFSPKGLGWYQLRTMFAEGKLAMLLDGPWDLGQVKTVNPGLYPHISMAPAPTPTHAAITGGAFYTILKKEANKQAVWDFIAFASSDEWQRRWMELLVQVPGLNVQPDPIFLKTNPGFRYVTEIAAKYATGFGYLPPGYELVATAFQTKVIDHVADIWSGGKPPRAALDDCQRELEAWAKTVPAKDRGM
jgi:multiple sugar transport system substrate-binding protein